jgi:hypothetical protein
MRRMPLSWLAAPISYLLLCADFCMTMYLLGCSCGTVELWEITMTIGIVFKPIQREGL